MISRRREATFLGSVDWWVVLIYVVLIFCGWINIYAAVYDDTHASIFDLGRRYGVQLVWMGVSMFLAISILLIDAKYYHILAFPLYLLSVAVLLGVLFFGTEVNGAKAWLMIGPVALQPTEFVKVTTALALARYMSNYGFDIGRGRDLFRVAVITGIPVLIVILQNDTGSALVYSSFLLMLYREGFNKWVYVALILVISLFVMSFLMEPAVLIAILIIACAVGEGITNGHWREKVIYLAALTMLTAGIWVGCRIAGWEVPLYVVLLAGVAVSLIFVFIYAYRYKIRNMLTFVLLFIGSLGFISAIDYVFDNVLQIHQQKRILDLLGLESDLKGWGYNVNQSKIAIGSGGFSGKGFLEGTQTKFNFVPEQSTDFIFCTVGEEWGFLGSSLVVVLFGVLIYRLMRMGERQAEPFGRIYCYCAASILLFHVAVNIGMTIGIMPVIGIPLPFFSYGGSSMVAFTILLFIAVKLDASRWELKMG